MEIKVTDNSSQAWDDFVIHHPLSTVYHLGGWARVINETFGHKPYYLYAWDGEKVGGVLPMVQVKTPFFGSCLVSLPFLSYGGTCADCEATVEELETKAAELASELRADYVEFRNLVWRHNGMPVRAEKSTFFLDVSLPEGDLFRRMRKQTRNRIRKALKHGLRVERGHGCLSAFYKVFSVAMREHGTPVMPFSFFSNIVATFNDMADIFVAYKGSTPVGAKISMLFKDTYYLVMGGYPSKYRPYLPNYLLTWEAIQHAKTKGASVIDFGRSTKDSGPADFKRYFGAVEKQLFFQYWLGNDKDLPHVTPNSPKYRLAISFWRRLPLAFTRLIGPQIVRYIP